MMSLRNIFGVLVLVVIVTTLSFIPSSAYASDADSPLQVKEDTTTALNTTAVAAHTGVTAGATTALQQKGFTLDGLAWVAAKAAINSIVNSTVQWINSGFKGQPAFATNLTNTLEVVGDQQANAFISQLTSNGSIKSPFQNQVASVVGTNYFQSSSAGGFFTQNAFTLGQLSSNPTAFLQGGATGFAQGGFPAFISTAMNPQNNAYGATLLAQNGLDTQVAQAQRNQQTELNWGKGFLSQKNCPSTTSTATKASSGPNTNALTSLADSANSAECALGAIINPGTTIEGLLQQNLGSGIASLVTASQINEIVNALLGQLVNQVLGPGGLTGISQPSPTTGGVSYFNQSLTSSGQLASSAGTTSSVSQSLETNFQQTVQSQIVQLQTFQTEWGSVNSAAQAAQTALQANSCAANQATLVNVVQPVLNQATSELAQAATGITDLNDILNELPATVTTSSDASQITQVSCDYTTLIGSGGACTASSFIASGYTLPSPADFDNALTQSTDTSNQTGVTPSDLTEMNQVAQSAATACGTIVNNNS